MDPRALLFEECLADVAREDYVGLRPQQKDKDSTKQN